LLTIDDALRTMVRDAVRDVLRDELRNLTEAAKPRARYLTAQQAADVAQVNPNVIYKWVSQGKLLPKRAGNRLRFAQDDLERFMSRKEGEVTDQDLDEKVVRMLGA